MQTLDGPHHGIMARIGPTLLGLPPPDRTATVLCADAAPWWWRETAPATEPWLLPGTADAIFVLSSPDRVDILHAAAIDVLSDARLATALERLDGSVLLASWVVGDEALWCVSSDVLSAPLTRRLSAWIREAEATHEGSITSTVAPFFDAACLWDSPASADEAFFLRDCPPRLKTALQGLRRTPYQPPVRVARSVT